LQAQPTVLLISPAPLTLPDAPPAGWARSADGVALDAQGSGWPVLAQAGEPCTLVVPAECLSWHRVRLPKTPAAKLEAVLAGLLEDHLLEDPAELHFALEPGMHPTRGAAEGWVAVCHKAWLRERLDELARRGWKVNRILPAATPQASPLLLAQGDGPACRLTLAGPSGVVCMPLEDATASAWVSALVGDPARLAGRCTTTPSAVAQAERLLPALAWVIQPFQQAWLVPLASGWDLAQQGFRLNERLRWQRAGQQVAMQVLKAPAWRPVRWGLAGLLLVQLIGLNLVAWQARQQLAATHLAIHDTLTHTFAHVTLVLNPQVQMQRELERLRTAHGQLGGADLESLLQTLGQIQPPPRLTQIDYRHAGAVQLSFQPLPAADQTQVRLQLERAGWQVQWSENQAQLVWGRAP